MRRTPQSAKAKSEKLKLQRAQNRGEDVEISKKSQLPKFSRSAYLDPKLGKKKKAAEKLESTWQGSSNQEYVDQNEVIDSWYWHRPIPTHAAIWSQDPDDQQLSCFRRPKWNYNMSKKELETNEVIQFKRWLKFNDEALDKLQKQDVGVYERNIEVWRQFWRTCEMSQVLLILIDIRLPTIHFTNSLKKHLDLLTEKQNKRVIYVFTKVDLVPDDTAACWEAWLKSQLSSTDQIVKLSTYQVVLGEQGKGRRKPFIKPESMVELLTAISTAHASLKSACENVPDVDFEDVAKEIRDRIDTTAHPNQPNASTNPDIDQGDTLNSSSKVAKRKARKLGRVQAENKKGGPKRKGFDVAFEEVGSPDDQEEQEEEQEQEHGDENANNERTEDDVLTIGLLGQPNVGKSSVINGLFGSSKVRASSTPGKTKHFQTLYLANKVRLADCPGLIWPSTTPRWAQVLGSTVPISQERQPSRIVYEIGQRMPLENILPLAPESVLQKDEKEDKRTWREGMVRTSRREDSNTKTLEILERYSIRAGYMTAKAGRPDVNRASNFILRQITTSQFKWAYLPNGIELMDNSNGIYIVDNNSVAETQNDTSEEEDDEVESDESAAEEPQEESEAPADRNVRSAFELLNVDEGVDEGNSDD
ncbi:Guanine nucleotide-binding protein-like 1 [Wallemia ichthyophaga EXF-994]|uniref:Guanine nucleotide-binding protein-like 1 n=1 Tax=Wallemia ichthyophaga (strain EXF-994 / CBS 113033) TaxID=1299270 RepID=R9AC71_WALI9|nr:Guanine nucleotide-binding protein-like 1 [Wallemia ichthyophaga EXF-994]EOQ99751.1 Guanine nucleotide-binding protein-like 1 [Wallemia ichthyophaga EXF-994]TIB30332.1 hypothetical protein E3P84_03373 [Wallemia ichthyophaga]TIB39794.1 hypothetical protein E3P83_03273 [Wallemia ichthyophaga]